MEKLTNGQLFRFACILVLWLLICWAVIASQPFSLRVLFVVVASGIIVFVPLYKKYIRKKPEDGDGKL